MSRLERVLLSTSSLTVGLSGAVYGVMKYLLKTSDPYAAVNHPLQPFFLKIHVLSAPMLVFALGLVFSKHVWRHLRGGVSRGRRSGVAAWVAVVPMVVSGTLIQIVTERGWLEVLVALHLVTGGLYLVGFLAHRVVVPNGRESEENQAGPAPAPASPSSGAIERSASSTKAM